MSVSVTAPAIGRLGRKSLVDGVVEAMTARILRGEMPPGHALPSEQELAVQLGVSRTAVREALNRLATARLVSNRHSSSKHVLDYRQSAGLELLAALLVRPDGQVDPAVVASVMEMRSALAPDIARLAALRATPAMVAKLRRTVQAMRAAGDDLATLQNLVSDFWSHLVDGADNIAYRLAFNSLEASYDQSKHLFERILASEIGDVGAYALLADEVAEGNATRAETLGRALVHRGEKAVKDVLGKLAQPRKRAKR